MKTKSFFLLLLLCAAAFTFSKPAYAQLAPTASPDQQSLLQSKNPELARNKKLVFDFWREVLEGGQLDLASKYLTKDYIQHNPNVPTGRQEFVDFFSQFSKPQPVDKTIKAPLISIVTEGDLVVLNFVKAFPDPEDESKQYFTTWFDMFRIEDGKIAEHWDSATK